MTRNLAAIVGVTMLLLGMAGESLGQVPQHPDRIRDTTQEILARPEFRAFPRLKPGQPASDLSGMRPGEGIPRLKSSRGLPPETGGEPKRGQGLGRQSNDHLPRQRGANGLPADAPEGDRPGGNRRGNLDDALGREDVFPEAGNVDGLLEDNPINANPQGRRPENDAGPIANNAHENGPGNPPNNVPHAAVPPPEANPANDQNENPNGDRPAQAGNPPRQADQNALPAPRPRQHADVDEAFGFPEPPVGELARFVGAMFHFLAWGILAVICGLIMWLIVKAIREYERPHAYAKANSGGQDMLDLEPAQAPGDLPADVYLGQAQKLAEQGRYREAVVQLVLGAMSRVERAGWVRFRRGMTVRDYLRGIHQFPAAHQGFRAIIRVFEPLAFGRREPTLAHFEQSLQGYETGFGLD